MLSWFAMLYCLLRGPYRQSMPETVRRSLYLFWILIVTSGGLVAWVAWSGAGSARAANYYHVFGLSVSLLCFALAAQLKRDAPVDDRSTLRALAAASRGRRLSDLIFDCWSREKRTVPNEGEVMRVGLQSYRSFANMLSRWTLGGPADILD